jgi:hypothetical protein
MLRYTSHSSARAFSGSARPLIVQSNPQSHIQEEGNERAVAKPSNTTSFTDASRLAIRNKEKILATF